MNALSGMTGFARAADSHGDLNWVWEARSVNGKGLDLRLRIPSDFNAAEAPVRKAFSETFKRGNIQISLTYQRLGSSAAYQIDEALYAKLSDFVQGKGETVDANQLLQVPGVVTEMAGLAAGDEKEALVAAIIQSGQALAQNLKAARDNEGAAMAPLLMSAIEQTEDLLAEAEGLAAIKPEAIRQKLAAKLAELLGEDIAEERLAQEAALLAIKADVREELDRLSAHCKQARKLMKQGSPIGRKLDFLSQEFNRETNTLCSKSSDIDLTQTGLALKSVIEQFREQAANVE